MLVVLLLMFVYIVQAELCSHFMYEISAKLKRKSTVNEKKWKSELAVIVQVKCIIVLSVFSSLQLDIFSGSLLSFSP